MKLLTVIVPTYNVEKYLDQCLKSFVIPEIMEELEVLIVNDGSTDTSPQIGEKYANNYPETFHMITKENGGHGSTINTGIENAEGRYFKVVDGDDWVIAEGLKNLICFLKTVEADMVLSNYYWVDDFTGKVSKEVPKVCPEDLYGKIVSFNSVSNQIFFKMHAITFRTEILKKIPDKIDEHCYYVDMEYITFPIPFIKTVGAVPDFVYMYRIGQPTQSVSMENMRKRCMQHERVLEHLLQYFDKFNENEYKFCMAEIAARVVTSQYKIYLSFGKDHKDKLIKMENTIRYKYPEIFHSIRNPAIRILRRSNYLLYGLISRMVNAIHGGN
ncbi:MAG: glycosyltransferase family 2 protein [Lacrimispora sphenoides]